MSSKYERKLLNILENEYGWVPIRAAGSMGNGDIIGINPQSDNSPMIIEVKKTSNDVFYSHARKRTKKQYLMMCEYAIRGINTFYAIRHVSGSRDNRWQMHRVTADRDKQTFRRGEGLTLDEVFNVE